MVMLLALLSVLVTQSAAQVISVSTEPSTNSIDVSWSVSGGSDVNAVTIHYSCLAMCGSACGVLARTTLENLASPGAVTLPNLEEYTIYNITVEAGGASVTTNVSTQPAAPTGAPSELLPENITASEVTLSWSSVSCVDRNSRISSYAIRYSPVSQEAEEAVAVNGSEEEGGKHTISGLHSSTNYSFQMAAVNEAGEEGPLSQPVYVETSTCNCRVASTLSARDVTLVSVLSTFVGTVLLHTGILMTVVAVFFRKIKNFLCGANTENDQNQYSAVFPRKWRGNNFKPRPAERHSALQLENFEPAVVDPEESYANFEQIKKYRASIISDFQPPQ